MADRPAGWVDGVGSSDARLITGMFVQTQTDGDVLDPLRVRPGIRDASGFPGQVTVGTNTVTVNPFQGVLADQSKPADGPYVVTLDAVKTLPFAAAHASLSRYDLVVAEIVNGAFAVNIYTGTNAASPVVPAPSGTPFMGLAQILVPPAGTAPTVSDLRQFTAAMSAILPVRGDADMPVPNGFQSQIVYRLDTGVLMVKQNGSWVPYRTPQGDTWHAATLQNGWVNYGGGYNSAAYTLMDDGWVRLRGLVKSGTVGATIFTLPVGYRPPARWLLATSTNNDVYGRIDVVNDGTVLAMAGSNAWLSLDNLSFSTYA